MSKTKSQAAAHIHIHISRTGRETFTYTSPNRIFGNAVLQLTAALQPPNDGMTDCRLVPLLFASPS